MRLKKVFYDIGIAVIGNYVAPLLLFFMGAIGITLLKQISKIDMNYYIILCCIGALLAIATTVYRTRKRRKEKLLIERFLKQKTLLGNTWMPMIHNHFDMQQIR